MDIATLVGILIGLGFTVGGIAMGVMNMMMMATI